MNQDQNQVQLIVLAIVIGGFGLAAVIYVAGYFLFLKMQKASRAKGRLEAEAESRDEAGSEADSAHGKG